MARNPWKKLLSNVKISGRIWMQTNRREQKAVELTAEDLERKFNEQNGKCHWFNIILDPQDIFESHNQLAISVDRLNNKEHYHFDNIVICCRLANLGKGRCPSEKFAKTVAEFKGRIV